MRAFGVALIAVAAASFAAASSSAAKPVRFKVTIDASRTTSWSFHRQSQQCATVTTSGAGNETVRLRDTIVVAAPSFREGVRATVSGSVMRNGNLTAVYTGTPCANEPWNGRCQTVPVISFQWFAPLSFVSCPATYAVPTTDCGTRSFEIRRGTGFYLGYGDGLATGDLSIQLVVEERIFRECPGIGKAPWGVFIHAKLPYSKLLRQKQVVIRGSEHVGDDDERFREEGLGGSSDAKWNIRFRRLP